MGCKHGNVKKESKNIGDICKVKKKINTQILVIKRVRFFLK
jgi:hypothetical protein